MKKIHLLGKAGEKFGKEFNLEVKHVKQLLRAIAVQRKGFYQFFIDESQKGMEYTVKRGDEFMYEGEEELSFNDEDIYIVPVAAGSGPFSDFGKKILGAILIIVGIIIGLANPFAGAMLLGAAMVGVGTYLYIDGMLGLLTDDSPANDESPAIFGGPVATVKNGVPIPLCYGRLEISGAPINFGFTTERIRQNAGWVNINNPDQEGAGDTNTGEGGGGDQRYEEEA